MTDEIGTGTTVDITVGGDTKRYIFLLYGDVNGDGNINLSDLVTVRGNIFGRHIFDTISGKAGDLYGEGNITLNVFVGIMSYVSESGTINQDPNGL